MKRTKRNFENYLNTYAQEHGVHTDPFWAYLRKQAPVLMAKGRLGTAIRRYDPILFDVEFRQWCPGR